MHRKKESQNSFSKLLVYTLIISMLSCNTAVTQSIDKSIENLESKLDSVIQSTMESEHIPGAAFVIVKDGEVILKKGYGFTSLGEEIKRVDPDSTIFRIGSITKTFTATSLLQLVDAQQVELHTDVNTYLTSLQVPNTFKKSVTSAHLLNHSAGFDELRGRVVYNKNQKIPLKTFLKDRLVRLREPGLVPSYSSFGIALAGLVVEDVSKMSLESYMTKYIWEPLGMNMTGMTLTEEDENYTSWGYEYRNGINIPQPWEYYHTYPASEINSTVTDMSKYMIVHLNDGIYNGQRILSKKMSMEMKSQQMSVQPEIAGFGYGFFEEYAKGLKTISHGGDMLGYSSYMTLVPEKNMGIFVVHHHEGTRLRYQVLDVILEHFHKKEPAPETKRLKPKKSLKKFAGNYKWTTYCHTCTDSWQPDENELVINNDNTFSIFGRKFYQVAPLMFKSFDGKRTMGFLENEKGEVLYMSTGGNNVFEKVD